MADIQKAAALPDSSSKADFHNLVDNATIRSDVITNAMIKNGVITSAKLVDFDSQTAGDILKTDGTNWSPLNIGTAGQVLQVNSGATLPKWGAIVSDIIFRGFELSTFAVDATAVVVQAGVLAHGTTGISKTTNTTITLATAGDWWDGTADTYGGGQGWTYIGVDISGNIKYLGANAPDKATYSSDGTEGSTAGVKHYWWDGSKHWRVIAGVRVDTDDQAAWGQLQTGNHIMLDIPQNLTTTVNASSWTDASSKAAGDASTLIPAISTLGIFGLSTNDNATDSGVWIRPNGSTWSTNLSSGIIGKAGSTACGAGGQRFCMTDSSQKINYQNQAGDNATTIGVEGYLLNIR